MGRLHTQQPQPILKKKYGNITVDTGKLATASTINSDAILNAKINNKSPVEQGGTISVPSKGKAKEKGSFLRKKARAKERAMERKGVRKQKEKGSHEPLMSTMAD